MEYTMAAMSKSLKPGDIVLFKLCERWCEKVSVENRFYTRLGYVSLRGAECSV